MNRTGAEVIVVGSINLDLIAVTRRIPSPGETVLTNSLTYRSGGKGSNQAVAARKAGASVVMVGAVGDDEFGRRLLADLDRQGVSTAAVACLTDEVSGVAMVVVDSSAENTITVSAGANRLLSAALVCGHLERALPEARVLVLQGEIPLETAAFAAARAAEQGLCVIFNASPLGITDSPHLHSILRTTDILIVNESEARQLSEGVDGGVADFAQHLRSRGPKEVVVTLGREGAVLIDQHASQVYPAYPVNAIDSTGAGDAFCGVLAAEKAAGSSTDHAIRVASAAGALATTALGAQEASPNRDAIVEFLNERAATHVR